MCQGKLLLFCPNSNFMKPVGQNVYRSLERDVKQAIAFHENQGVQDRNQIEQFLLANAGDFIEQNAVRLNAYCIHDFDIVFKMLIHNVCQNSFGHWSLMNIDTIVGDEQESDVDRLTLETLPPIDAIENPIPVPDPPASIVEAIKEMKKDKPSFP